MITAEEVVQRMLARRAEQSARLAEQRTAADGKMRQASGDLLAVLGLRGGVAGGSSDDRQDQGRDAREPA